MSVGAVNKQTGERIPTAGMPAVDSVLSGTSTNPVQNRVVKAALDEKADTDIVASDFDATASYTAGNYCIYEGKFYKFKTSHSGAWSASDVDEIKIAGELSSLMSGLTNYNMVPKVRTVLGTILVSETEKVVTATKNGYIVVNTNNVGASMPTVRCYMYIINKEYGCVSSDTIPAYTGVYFGMLPVEAGDNVVIHLSGHNVDATVSQIAYS